MAAKDQEELDSVMIWLAHSRIPLDLVQQLATAILRQQPHDIQEWWDGECNCDGHLN